MDFFCVRRHIGLFFIFWMSLSKRPSTSSARVIQALNKASTISLVETIAWAKVGPFSSAACISFQLKAASPYDRIKKRIRPSRRPVCQYRDREIQSYRGDPGKGFR
jgi:hypothetical protein